jgi:hypothetical protein
MTCALPTADGFLQRCYLLRRLTIYFVLAGAWIGIAIVGWAALLSHTYQPARTADAVESWPESKLSMPSTADYRIVIFAHPYCPCTRATLNKLDESLTRLPGNTAVCVIFATVGLDLKKVADSPTVSFARQLKGVDVRMDDSGDEVRRFRATVSGEVFAFDRQGQRIFHGGITAGRGHHGDSVGQQQLERLVCGLSHEVCEAPIFGCKLPTGSSATVDGSTKNPRDELPLTP